MKRAGSRAAFDEAYNFATRNRNKRNPHQMPDRPGKSPSGRIKNIESARRLHPKRIRRV